MDYIYEYETLPTGARQYDDIDLRRSKIVKAKYVDTYAYRGNPYIEALPFCRTPEEVARAFIMPDIPTTEELYSLPVQAQDMLVEKLRDYRIALPYHANLENEFSRTLRESYASRTEYAQNAEVIVGGESFKTATGLRAFHAGEAVIGFSMLGVAGSGKSTAMNMVLDGFPQVIIHEFDGQIRIQIVYLFVTCEANSNFNALYQAIGRAIDVALQNGTNTYEGEILSVRSLGQKSMKVREWIQKLSIGAIIFDEIQNIDLRSTKENSIEALLTINNETHVGMGVLGTEEAFRDLFAIDRTARRFSAYIPASQYCDNKKTLQRIVKGIFVTQLFEPPVFPDEEIIDAFIEMSNGVIAYIVLLYYYVSKDYLRRREKPEICGSYIREIAEQKSKIILDSITRHRESKQTNEVQRRKLIREMNTFGDSSERREAYSLFEELSTVRETAIARIAEEHPKYNSSSIEKAVTEAEAKGMNTEEELISEAVMILEKKKGKNPSSGPGKAKSVESMLKDLEQAEHPGEP